MILFAGTHIKILNLLRSIIVDTNMDIEKKIVCEVCGNDNSEKFSQLYDKIEYKIVNCDICDFVFIPVIYRKEISYENYRDEDVLAEVRKGNNRLKIKRHKLRIKFIRKFINNARLFDVGTGWGHFLYTAKLTGFETDGVEISKLMHYYAENDLGLKIRQGDFFDIDLPENYYDVVTMWDVLEHIDEPGKAVKKVHKILKENGLIILQVPQIDSYISKKQKENWGMFSIEHLSYFSKSTIEKFLERYGFETVKIKSSYEFKQYIMFTLLPFLKRRKEKNLKNENISNSERQGFFNRITGLPHFILVIIMFFHNIIYNTLSCLKIGEEMIVVAKKK